MSKFQHLHKRDASHLANSVGEKFSYFLFLSENTILDGAFI